MVAYITFAGSAPRRSQPSTTRLKTDTRRRVESVKRRLATR